MTETKPHSIMDFLTDLADFPQTRRQIAGHCGTLTF
jgi:hypothetical protein